MPKFIANFFRNILMIYPIVDFIRNDNAKKKNV